MRIVLKDAGGTREEEERGMYRYTPRGVCSRAIDIDLDGDKVARVECADQLVKGLREARQAAV